MTLNNGRNLNIDENSFKVPELLFQPILNGTSTSGIHQITYDSIKRSDVDIRD